jgi:hypothetical protein
LLAYFLAPKELLDPHHHKQNSWRAGSREAPDPSETAGMIRGSGEQGAAGEGFVEAKDTSARLSNFTCSRALLISCSVFSASAEKTSARLRVAARLEVRLSNATQLLSAKGPRSRLGR